LDLSPRPLPEPGRGSKPGRARAKAFYLKTSQITQILNIRPLAKVG